MDRRIPAEVMERMSDGRPHNRSPVHSLFLNALQLGDTEVPATFRPVCLKFGTGRLALHRFYVSVICDGAVCLHCDLPFCLPGD